MILDNDTTISLSSTFSPLLPGGGVLQKGITLLSQFTKELGITESGFSGRHKAMGYHLWESTDPIMVPGITVSFYVDPMNVNGLLQVIQPMQELMKLPLPDEVEGTGILDPPGGSLLSLFSKGFNAGQISVEIGNILRIPNALIKKAEPTFSNDVDSAGNPIWGKVSLDIQSLETATRKSVTERIFSQPV